MPSGRTPLIILAVLVLLVIVLIASPSVFPTGMFMLPSTSTTLPPVTSSLPGMPTTTTVRVTTSSMPSPPPVCGNGIVEKGETCDGPKGCNMSNREMCAGLCTRCEKMKYCGDGKCETWEDQVDNTSRHPACGFDSPPAWRKMCSADCGCPKELGPGYKYNATLNECVLTFGDGVCAASESDCRDCSCDPGPGVVVAKKYECRKDSSATEREFWHCVPTGETKDGKTIPANDDGICVNYKPKAKCVDYHPENWAATCHDCSCPPGYYCDLSYTVNNGKCRTLCGDGKCAAFDPASYDWADNGFTVYPPYFPAELPNETWYNCCQDSNGADNCKCPCKNECVKWLDSPPESSPNQQTHSCMNCQELMFSPTQDFNGACDVPLNSRCTAGGSVICTTPGNRMTVDSSTFLPALQSFCNKCSNSKDKLSLLVINSHGSPSGIQFGGGIINTDWIAANRESLTALRGCFASDAHVVLACCLTGSGQVPTQLAEALGVTVSCDQKMMTCSRDNDAGTCELVFNDYCQIP